MEIKSRFVNPDKTVSFVAYKDTDSFDFLEFNKIKQIYAVCLLDREMVIVYHGKRKEWGLVGGSIEKGEALEDCLKREIREETNMEVLNFEPIGYQEVKNNNKLIYQLRYVCNVKPYGEFFEDSDGKITKIKIIDPKDYKQYFDWGEVGERIIGRALDLKK